MNTPEIKRRAITKTERKPSLKVVIIRSHRSNRIEFVCSEAINLTPDTVLLPQPHASLDARGSSAARKPVDSPIKHLSERLCEIKRVSTNWSSPPNIDCKTIRVSACDAQYVEDIENEIVALIAEYFDVAVDNITVTIDEHPDEDSNEDW